ncbi:chemotaxis protein methyltransferase CheR [Rhodanobacter sp. K2T2]|uniref:CheR family methyltransferase n=1 Tax=Rhodanobacter sp. K2T2 TaxID=2723085 RepID=UPI0015CD59D6|nr:CheR family methyltransferase [Rhodanobacter sp. K2T2]NYE30780.1 chemotaxis protein methyltransferase CheR [Rhodanobacter sp. K2T2]
MFDAEAIVDQATRKALFARVRRHTGIDMADRKWTLLHGRLRRRLQALSLSSYGDYLAVLDSSTVEVGHFIDMVTTNETSFFRTPRIWDYLWNDFLPAWYAGNAGSTLQMWSAAASTGEEAYSAAMLFEEFHQKHTDFNYRILGTDIAQRVLDVGGVGTYFGRNVEGLQKARPAMLEKYFQPDGVTHAVAPSLRAHVTFRTHNLYQRLKDPTRFDLVMLRNVLIYFDEAGQETVLENVRQSMASKAVLLVGESESLNRIRTGFTYQQPLIYRNADAAA